MTDTARHHDGSTPAPARAPASAPDSESSSPQPAAAAAPVWAVLGDAGPGAVAISLRAASELERITVPAEQVPETVAQLEGQHRLRWVWHDTAARYATLLAAGVRVHRCHDLRLCHVILRRSVLADSDALARESEPAWAAPVEELAPAAPALFDLDEQRGVPTSIEAAIAEFDRQRAVLDRTDGRLRLLVAAESSGALVAAEMRAAGVPWHEPTHLRILDEQLGARDAGGVPAHMAALAARVREQLGDPSLQLDSPPKLLRALHRVGIMVESTSKWQLAEQEHPVIEPLLAYKKLARLASANGWSWLAEWVHEGRFRPVYIPGGVVTGRWASSGGGALQLPRQLREAVRPDPGFRLVVADVAQLEPRVLAAMSRDQAMARAARGRDLYQGLVDAGVVETRQQAKYAVLGAMYGSTTGESGRLVPRMRKAYPQAMAMVDAAAATGEQGGQVHTLLGRTSPVPPESWFEVQRRASGAGAGQAEESQARRSAREWGRFTRNFVVQGTAAEWAMIWLAEIRQRLHALGLARESARASGPVFEARAHLAFFLHDEVILHVPESLADAAAQAVHDAADAAVARLFPHFRIDMPLDLHIGDDAAK